MSEDTYVLCNGCHWSYSPLYTDDTGYCGPCSRERGLSPRTAQTDRIDAKVREIQIKMRNEGLA